MTDWLPIPGFEYEYKDGLVRRREGFHYYYGKPKHYDQRPLKKRWNRFCLARGGEEFSFTEEEIVRMVYGDAEADIYADRDEGEPIPKSRAEVSALKVKNIADDYEKWYVERVREKSCVGVAVDQYYRSKGLS